VLFRTRMFGCFDGTILGIWFDELVFGIGVTSPWRYFYNIQGTGPSAGDQICVTRIWCVQGWGEREDVILEIRGARVLSVAEIYL